MLFEESPTLEELRAEDPPLSPRTTALFVGTPPDGDTEASPEGMRFFRRSLNQAQSYDELVEWIAAGLVREACEWLRLDPDELD